MPRAKKTPDTYVLMLADMSGSMGHLQSVVIDQMNEFFKDRKGDPGNVYVTMVTFDTILETVFENVPAKDVPRVTPDDYHPRGMTALFDAIADTCTKLESGLDKKARVLVSVLTDGLENASREYALVKGGKERIKGLIQRLEGKGNWTFTYLSADPNAFADAQGIGINYGNVAQFVPTLDGVSAAGSQLRASTAGYTHSDSTNTKSFYQSETKTKIKSKV